MKTVLLTSAKTFFIFSVKIRLANYKESLTTVKVKMSQLKVDECYLSWIHHLVNRIWKVYAWNNKWNNNRKIIFDVKKYLETTIT